MANIKLIGLEPSAASQIGRALDGSFHQIEILPLTARHSDVMDADIVFAGGEHKQYIPLLKRLRAARPSLPFIVVTRIPETSDWLDALEAGATDYCSAPFEARQMNWLMQAALSSRLLTAAA
jgi:DNA-binding response OmpR family regulator